MVPPSNSQHAADFVKANDASPVVALATRWRGGADGSVRIGLDLTLADRSRHYLPQSSLEDLPPGYPRWDHSWQPCNNQLAGEPAGSRPPTAETAGAGIPPWDIEAEDKANAIAAAHAASTALEELLRFAREGALSNAFAFTDETVLQLADALRLAIGIEQPRRADAGDRDGAETLGQLAHAIFVFTEDWSR